MKYLLPFVCRMNFLVDIATSSCFRTSIITSIKLLPFRKICKASLKNNVPACQYSINKSKSSRSITKNWSSA